MLLPSISRGFSFGLMFTAAAILVTTATKDIIFCFWTASAPPPPTHTHAEDVNALEGGEAGWRHVSINADTNRKLILFCVRWGVRRSDGRWMQKKFIFIARLGTSRRARWSPASHKVSFADSSRRAGDANARRHTQPFYPAHVSLERERFVLSRHLSWA